MRAAKRAGLSASCARAAVRFSPAGLVLTASWILAACSPLVLAWRAPVRISRYHGDGAISRIPDPLNPGFKVDFEEFALSKLYKATYRVGGLPERRHYDAYRAAVVVHLTPDEDAVWPPMPAWVTSGSVGTLTLTLEDEMGTILFHGSHEISNLRWESFVDDLPYGRFHAPKEAKDQSWEILLDSIDRSHQSPALLKANYVPGPDAPDRLARVRIMAGGFE